MDWWLTLIYLVACAGAAATGVLFQPGAWYDRLDKPAWTPPRWLFPVAWTILYVMIAVAAARVAQLPGSAYAMAFWSLQIVLNALWTPIFFGLHLMRAGLAVMVMLWLAVAATLATFLRLDPVAGLLLVPYIIWISYALALNLSVQRRNPSAEGAPRGSKPVGESRNVR
ncbi:tryptophan-rich sensory protein [Rhodobacteraceae bacterium MCCB 386]|nr:tryptophan-rich sensory protein [Roseitranquillus sediminis]